jgi:TolB-like protein
MRHTAARRISSAQTPAFSPARVPVWQRPIFIAGSLAGVGVVAAGLWMALSGPPASAAVGRTFDPTKIAVMYFEDRSGGDLGYLADGLTEGLIDQLRQVRELDVLSKDAVGRFRGPDVSIDSVISALEPGTIVQGSVRSSGDRVRFSVNVIDGNTGAEKGEGMAFELPGGDELALRRHFADSVGLYLRNFVGEVVRARQLEAGTGNSGAWNLAQRAEKLRKDAVAASTRGDSAAAVLAFAQADSILAQAEALDPGWSSPIAMRARLALNRAQAARAPLLRRPFLIRGIEHANRALQVDSNDVDALESRGQLYHGLWSATQLSDTTEARRQLTQARADLVQTTRLDPTRATAWVALSSVHAQLFDPHQSYLAALRAYEEDAYALNVEGIVRQMYATAYDIEEFGKAQEHCDEGARRFPGNWLFVSCKLSMRLSGQISSGPDSAWNELRTLSALVPPAAREVETRRHQMFVAAAIAQAGLQDSARRVIESARAGRDIDPGGRLLTAEALARIRLGTRADTAIAFEKLREYVIGQAAHGSGFANTTHWWWKGLRQDQRWNEYLRVGAGS